MLMAKPIFSQTPLPTSFGKIAQMVVGRGRGCESLLVGSLPLLPIRNEQVALGGSCFLQFWLLRNLACWEGGQALYKMSQKEATAGLAKEHKAR